MAIAIETFLNPAKFTEELTSKLKDYRLPGIDFDAVVAATGKMSKRWLSDHYVVAFF